MTRREAYEYIATLLDEWFPELGYTPQLVERELGVFAEDDSQVWDSSIHYADFTMTILERAGLLE